MALKTASPFDLDDIPESNAPQKGKQGLTQDEIESWWSNADMPSMIKEFVDPGDDPKKLLMRGFLINNRQATAAARYLARCEEFGYQRGKERLLYKLAADCGVRSHHVLMLLMAVTRRIEPNLIRSDGKWSKSSGDQPAQSPSL
jgi:hypothetical protein